MVFMHCYSTSEMSIHRRSHGPRPGNISSLGSTANINMQFMNAGLNEGFWSPNIRSGLIIIIIIIFVY